MRSFASHVEKAGYSLALSPMFEDVGVFVRGMGETTEVVSKEMYDFLDKGDRHVALRPEGTASIARAFVQHRPSTVWKVWYATPAFRYERPQAGRFRQHHQLGVEAIGTEDPDIDAEVVALAAGFYGSLGLTRVSLAVGSMGDAICRPAYVALLASFLEERSADLCGEHHARWEVNPLRVLDCKRPECRKITEDAPRLIDQLCEPCARHFSRFREGLEALGVRYEVDHRLVRGLDYYTRTTFEFAADALDTAQNGVGGGGRYDGLVEALGGPATPGIGFAAGVERILLACDAEGAFPRPEVGVGVFVVDLVGGREARALTFELRRAGLRADRAFDNRSLKAQLKIADRSGADIAVIVGPDELAAGTVTVRPLRGPERERAQRQVPRARVVEELREALG